MTAPDLDRSTRVRLRGGDRPSIARGYADVGDEPGTVSLAISDHQGRWSVAFIALDDVPALLDALLHHYDRATNRTP